MQFQAPRGTSDILPQEQEYWRFFRSRAEEMAARFGYERIDTPIFEDARLFVRGGRLTGFGRASAWAVAIVATITLVLANVAQTYATYDH